MRTKTIACMLLLGALVPALMGPTGGLPSRPTFQQATATNVLSTTNGSFVASSTTPGFVLDETDGGTNQRFWRTYAAAGSFNLDLVADAGTGARGIFSAARSAASVSSLSLGNATDNPAYNFLGTGLTTFNTAGEAVALKGNASSSSAVAYMAFRDSGGTRIGYVGDDGGSDTTVTLRSDTGTVRLNANGNTIAIDSSGNATVNSVAFTPTATTATGTVTGCSTAPTTTVRLERIGNRVTISVDPVSCTSNATTFALTGAVPSGFQLTRQQDCVITTTDNSAQSFGRLILGASTSTLTFARVTGSAAWTSSGTKAVDQQPTCTFITN